MRLTRALLARHFGDIWPAHNRALEALLVTCRRCVGGDLGQMRVPQRHGRGQPHQPATGHAWSPTGEGLRPSLPPSPLPGRASW